MSDRGIGIPENERAMLYLSRRIAEMHGGRLELETTGPAGSVFALALPLAA